MSASDQIFSKQLYFIQTTIICDIVVLYLQKGGKYYKDKKFQYVEQVDNDYTVSNVI